MLALSSTARHHKCVSLSFELFLANSLSRRFSLIVPLFFRAIFSLRITFFLSFSLFLVVRHKKVLSYTQLKTKTQCCMQYAGHATFPQKTRVPAVRHFAFQLTCKVERTNKLPYFLNHVAPLATMNGYFWELYHFINNAEICGSFFAISGILVEWNGRK